MMVSPGSSSAPNCATMLSVISPAGNMTHTARGFSSRPTSCLRSVLPVIRSPTSALTAAGVRLKTTHRCPLAARRRTMLPPMRPKPIMPSCIWPSPVVLLCERLPRGVLERRQPGRDVRAEMDAQGAPAAFSHHLEVAARLRGLDDTEGVFLVRYLEIGGVVAG